MQDEFENTYDFLGDGSASFLPVDAGNKGEHNDEAHHEASAKLPKDDVGAEKMRFEGVRPAVHGDLHHRGKPDHLVGGVYNTVGLNEPDGTGDTSPQEILDGVDVDALKEEYHAMGAFKNGPRLWTLDWVEVMVGEERDFNGLKARWVTWLDVPEEMRKHEAVAYKVISVKRDTQFGINAGSPAFLLDDPEGNTWCMKSASLIVTRTRPTRA